MDAIFNLLSQPWPWYVAGPIIGSLVPLMILMGNRFFGVSKNFEHMCAIAMPDQIAECSRQQGYNWRDYKWSLFFVTGIVLGGVLAGFVFVNPEPIAVSAATQQMFAEWGITERGAEFAPAAIYGLSPRNIVLLLVSGLIIGFGTRYANGCTSGHCISGVAMMLPESVIAAIGIFGGGVLAAWLIVPMLF